MGWGWIYLVGARRRRRRARQRPRQLPQGRPSDVEEEAGGAERQHYRRERELGCGAEREEGGRNARREGQAVEASHAGDGTGRPAGADLGRRGPVG